jgi:hypothetical protein
VFIVTNKAAVARGIQRNRFLFWLGVGCLVGSMGSLLLGADPSRASFVFILGYPLLAAGVILSKRGSFNNRAYGVGGYKLKSEEVMINETLKGVPPRYHLYNYVTIDGVTIDHLLVTPLGLMLIMIKQHVGKVKADHDSYRRKGSVITSIGTFGEPGIGSPSRDLTAQVKKVREWFEKEGFDLPTDGVVVFPYAEIIGAEEMSFPVCTMPELRQAIRGWGTDLLMNSDEQLEVEKLIVQQLPAEQVKETEELLEMPASKRAALLAAAEREKAEVARQATAKDKDKERATANADKKKEKEVAGVSAAANAKNKPEPKTATTGTNANPYGTQRLGINGKPLPPKMVREKPHKRNVAPLPKITPGAFGDNEKRK